MAGHRKDTNGERKLEMKTVRVRITGTQPLLLHADNIDWADQMEEWRNDSRNRKKSKAGDDRTPPFRWIGALTYDDAKEGCVAIPADYLMKAIMQGAALVPSGKGKATLKSQSQSGLLINESAWPLEINGKPILMADIQRLMSLPSFREHQQAVRKMGFDLFVKRASIGQQKHVRVRPRFERGWSCQGQVTLLDDSISVNQLAEILDNAGRLKGLGSWRPGGKTPGQFGTFAAEML